MWYDANNLRRILYVAHLWSDVTTAEACQGSGKAPPLTLNLERLPFRTTSKSIISTFFHQMLCQLVSPHRWEGGVLTYSPRGWLKRLCVVRLKARQTFMIKWHQPQCTGFWEMGSTPETRGEKANRGTKENTFSPQCPLFEISPEDFKQAICDKDQT